MIVQAALASGASLGPSSHSYFRVVPSILLLSMFTQMKSVTSLRSSIPALFTLLACLLTAGLVAQDYQQTVDSLEQVLPEKATHDERLKVLSECLRHTLYNDLDLAYSYVLRFEEEALLSQDSSEIARSKNFYGLHAATAGDHYRAISEYEDALVWYLALQDTMMIGMMHNNIGAAYEFQADRTKSLEYFEQAVHYFKAVGQEDWAFYAKYNMADQYYAQDRLLEAEPIYQEGLRYFEAHDDRPKLMETQVRLAEITFLTMGASDGLVELRALDLDPETMDRSTRTRYEELCCRVYTEMDMLDPARAHCEKAVKVSSELGAQDLRKEALDAQYLFLKRQGKYEEALSVHEDLMMLNDSVVNAMKDKQIVNLLTKYEIREKEKELGVKNMELEQRDQEADNFRLLLALIGVILLGAIVFTISRMRTNQQLRKQKKLIEKSLNDRELLLREIHHRVKNNLQVISSILSLQSREITDEAALKAVNESRARVKSMALIHQDLYGDEDLRGIKAKAYITKLSRSLFSTYRVDADRVRLHTEIDDLLLDVDTTLPLGLILNELVTNSLKYAFPDERSGDLYISLKEEGEELLLSVRDTGVGIPAEKEQASMDSFGMKMIRAFSKKLDASWSIDGQEGTRVEMRIKNYKVAGRE